MGTHWIDELAAEKMEFRRELEEGRRRRALATQKLARAAPNVWQRMQGSISAAVEAHNRKCIPGMCLGVSLGSQEYSLFIRGVGDANSLAVRLDVPSATIFCTAPADGIERPTFQVAMAGDSKWSIVGYLTKRVIPLDQASQLILKDFMSSALDRVV